MGFGWFMLLDTDGPQANSLSEGPHQRLNRERSSRDLVAAPRGGGLSMTVNPRP